MRQDLVDIFEGTKRRLDTPDKWCQISMARSEGGRGVDPLGKAACQWCLTGAIYTCTYPIDNDTHDLYYKSIQILDAIIANSRGCFSCSYYNDTYGRKHEDIISLLDEGIEYVKTMEGPND